MNTIIPGALPPLVARVQETGTPHHRLPGYSDDVSNVLALESRVGSKSESVEETPNPLSEMTCVYFDDELTNRVMIGRVMGKMGFKGSGVFDTSANAPSIEESEVIEGLDIMITDVNDSGGSDPSGGLRRGEMALKAGKIVIFVSARTDNKDVLDKAFYLDYGGQYIFLAKPYDFADIQKSIETLVAQRKASKS